MAASFVIRNSSDGQLMFVLKAGNNEVILASEFYTQKQNAENGIESVRKNAPDDFRFDRRRSKAGGALFLAQGRQWRDHRHERDVFLGLLDGARYQVGEVEGS